MLQSDAMRSLSIAVLFLFCACACVPAAIVDANLFEPLPFEFPYPVDNANGVNYELFIFEVPNYAAVSQINGLTLRFDVFDDGRNDRQESFKLVLDIPGRNVEVLTFLDNLGSNVGALDPLTAYRVEHTLTQTEVNAIVPSIQITNGLFLVRVNRLEGDFYVNQAGATLDVQYVPEPGTAGLMASAALLAAAAAFWRRQ
jgi:hypothetical protein